MYRAPDSSKFLHPKFKVVFHKLLFQLSLKECIFLGDSNVNLLKRSDNCELQLFGFKQLTRIPTRITNDTDP